MTEWGLLLSLVTMVVSVWVFIVVGRPAVATARLAAEASSIRDRVIDGVLAQDYRRSDPSVDRLLRLCDKAITTPAVFGWSEAVAFRTALAAHPELVANNSPEELAAVDSRDSISDRALSKEWAELAIALRRFMIDYSSLWWLFGPLCWYFLRVGRESTPRLVKMSGLQPSVDVLANLSSMPALLASDPDLTTNSSGQAAPG